MNSIAKTFAHGTLLADTNSWLLAGDHVVALDVAALDPFDTTLEHESVSVVGRMGFPPSAPTVNKLIVEKLASHDAIRRRAHELYASGQIGSAVDHWISAERELLQT